MIEQTFNLLMLLVATGVVAAYVCRLGLLQWQRHQPSVIVLHVAGTGAAFGAGLHAWQGVADLQDVLSLVLAGAWIVVSITTWRGKVPEHWERRA